MNIISFIFQLSSLVFLSSASPTNAFAEDLSTRYPGYYIPDVETPTNRVEMANLIEKIKRRLKMCQPMVCNKCIKIIRTNQRSRRYRACSTLLKLESCCPIRNHFLSTGPFWLVIEYLSDWLIWIEKSWTWKSLNPRI